MQSFFKNTKFEIAMPLSGLITVVAGLALFYRVSDGFNSDWMGSTAGIVLSIGSVAGLAAFLHGSTMIGPVTRKMTALMNEIGTQGTPPSEAQMGQMRGLHGQTRMHGQISVGLMIIAVIGMVSARYLLNLPHPLRAPFSLSCWRKGGRLGINLQWRAPLQVSFSAVRRADSRRRGQCQMAAIIQTIPGPRLRAKTEFSASRHCRFQNANASAGSISSASVIRCGECDRARRLTPSDP